MSYSFSFTADNKESAKARAADEWANIVMQQPNHVRDRDAALTAINGFIDLLEDDETKAVSVSCHGSISWQSAEENPPLIGGSAGIGAYLVTKETAVA